MTGTDKMAAEILVAQLKAERAEAQRKDVLAHKEASKALTARSKPRAASVQRDFLWVRQSEAAEHDLRKQTGLATTRDVLKATAFTNQRNPSGIAINLANTIAAIARLEIECRYDVFHERMLVQGQALELEIGSPLDHICLVLRTAILQANKGFDPGSQNTFDAVHRLCLANCFDPVRDYLTSLQHDGSSRLDTWLISYLGADDNSLNRAIGRKMLIAAVRRARKPGCKFDYIVVLEGPQGSGKSTVLRILAGDENFSDAEILAADQREQQELISGVWICELSELAGLRKTEIERVKLFASKTCDSARPAYGRSRIDRPRRCIFVGTTNDAEYLLDPTGNRRFWPVTTNKIDLIALRRDRDQLWAEAASAEATGEDLTIGPDLWADATARQASRLITDPWDDQLEGIERLAPQSSGSIVKVDGEPGSPGEWRVSSDYLFRTFLKLDDKSLRSGDARRLAGVMRRLGWAGPKKMRFGVRTLHAYTKPVE